MNDSDSSLHRHASHATIWQLLLAIVGTLVTVVPGTYYVFRQSLRDEITHQFGPYEHLFYGSQLEADNLPEEAIAEFEAGFDSTVTRSADLGKSARLSAYLVSYLRAMALSDKPTKYRAQFEKCRDLFVGHVVTESAAHLRNEGWYYLRVGELDPASKFFDASLKQAKVNNSREDIAWAEYGISFVSLCNGDAKSAYDQSGVAAEKLPMQQFVYETNDPINKEFASIYPKFANALQKLQEMFGRDANTAEKH